MLKDFTDLLLGSGAITSLTGKNDGVPAVTWNTRKQASATPAIVLHLISSVPEYSDEGEAGLFASRIQADIWASTHAGALALANALKSRLSGIQETYGSTDFEGIFVDDEQNSFESSESERLYRVRIDLIVMHSEAGD